jgi:hypothetical protein
MRTFQRISRLIRPAVAMPVLAALALAGLMVLSLGCGGETERPAASAPSINPRLPDVPVPAGFKFKGDQSSDRVVGGFRAVEHVYEGDSPLRQIAEFYRRQMPTHGWTQKEETFSGGRQRFMFTKGGDTCNISIWDDWGTKVMIKVLTLGTKSAEPLPPPSSPPPAPAKKRTGK